jgi:pyridoxine 4-dehydrogenase
LTDLDLGLTPRPGNAHISEEQAFEAMRTAIKLGCTIWNGGLIYGTPENNSLTLLRKYFEKYPEDAAKVQLNIKGCTAPGKLEPDGSREGVFRDVQQAIRELPTSVKKIDMFEPARVDKKVPLEETMNALKECQEKGWIGGVALSEASGETIRKASKIVNILAVEYELGLFTTQALTNGVGKACAELQIPIHALVVFYLIDVMESDLLYLAMGLSATASLPKISRLQMTWRRLTPAVACHDSRTRISRLT